MKKLTFLEIAEKILSEKKVPLSYMEILEIAEKKGYNKQLEEKDTKIGSLVEELYKDVKENPESPFEKIGSKPTRFILKNVLSEYMVKKNKSSENEEGSKYSFTEKLLHTYLTYHNWKRLNMYTKTIFYEKSTARKFIRWLHPNMVGIQFLSDVKTDYNKYNFVKAVDSYKTKIFSFEIVKKLAYNNLREAFFKAVSSSSWGNEGYLVTAEIDNDDEFMNDIGNLSTRFGIGLIKINIESPELTKVLFPSKHRNKIDWNSINMLSNQNSDFKSLLINLKEKLYEDGINEGWFDKIYRYEDLSQMLKEKV